MKITKIAFMFLAAVTFTLTGCQKEKTTEPKDENTTSLQQLSSDEQSVEAASDEALNDANTYLSNSNLKSTMDLVCNATVDSMVIANDSATYYIRYHGNNCANTLYRTGNMTIRHKVSEHWWEPMTTAIIRLMDYHVVNLSNNNWLTMNGVHWYQNVSGSNASTIIHRVWGTVVTAFSDQTTSTWNCSRQKSLTGTLGTLILTFDGFGESNGLTNLSEWGVNRAGEAFYSQVQEVITLKQECGWDPCSGIMIHSIPAASKSATVTFGFNDNNLPIGPGECPTKYRLDWQAGGNSGTFYLLLP